LGEAHQKKYLRKIEHLQAMAKADPHNEDLRSQIQQQEALYINVAIDGNDSVLQHRYGVEFADEIMPAYKKSLGSETIDNTANSLVNDMAQFGFVYSQKFVGEFKK
jgi:predicted nuclease of restriction endonuclease-like RecB superfamily